MFFFLIVFTTVAVMLLAGLLQLILEFRQKQWQWQWRDGFMALLSYEFWILVGIVLPLAAIGLEKFTEICARAFFDPIPTDWHLLLITLVPVSNLIGEILTVPVFRNRLAWVNGPLFRWINGVAIGISGFYALWFIPIALICSMLLLIGFFTGLCYWAEYVMTTLINHPADLLQGYGAMIWGPPLGIPIAALFFLLPAAPILSCLACLRTRSRLFAMTLEAASDQVTLPPPRLTRAVHPGFIALGTFIFGVSLFLMFKIWLPYVFSGGLLSSSSSAHASLKYIVLTYAPPILFFAIFFWPSPISPLQWFQGQRLTPVPYKPAGKPFEKLFLPVAFGLFALLVIEIPSTATRVAMNMALDPDKSAQGLLLLRAFGNDDSMLRMCYERSHATDIIGSILTWGKPVPAEKAREMYYRATGRPFNTRFVPAAFRGKIHDFIDWSQADGDDVFDWDTELAGETVGGVVRGVSLGTSKIQGNIDAVSHMAKIDWDMQFENKSQFQREARAQILLPPHAVVSDVWLWVNGIPRQAVFNSRGLTRAAYRAVVQRRRDPLLVTTYGPDRVLAQCFPVPPLGTMHIKLSITAPLHIVGDNDSKAFLAMPIFLERNFQVSSHSLEISANSDISNSANILSGTLTKLKEQVLKGTLSNQELSQGKGTIAIERKMTDRNSWCHDTSNSGNIIVANVCQVKATKPEKLVIVVDGSAAVAADAAHLAQDLRSIPETINLTLIRAGDSVEIIAHDIAKSSDPKWASALDTLQSQTFVGGQDDAAALVKSFDFIQDREPAAILWLHGPQPVKIDKSEMLADLLRRHQSNVTLYELQVENGPNRTVEALDGIVNVNRVPVIVSYEAALQDLFSRLIGRSDDYEMIFDDLSSKEPIGLTVDGETHINMSPLWANQWIARLRSLEATDKNKRAVEIAKQYRVVTPVSGAVVLETDADYKRFGLAAPQPKQAVNKKGIFKAFSSQLSTLPLVKKQGALFPSTRSAGRTFTSGSSRAENADQPEFEQKASSSPQSGAKASTEIEVSDDSQDVQAVPEPESWLFLLSIGALLLLFRRKILSVISK